MRPIPCCLAATLVALALVACTDSTEPGLGPPAKLVIQAGGVAQTALFGQAVPTAPAVLVTDAGSHPVPGVAVAFAIASGGGSLSSTTQMTNSSGVASVAWTLGNTFGANTMTAAAAGLPPVTFSATAILSEGELIAFNLTDPAGDFRTYSSSEPYPPVAPIDLLSLRGEFKRDSLILTATFADPPFSIRGYVEFDIDDDQSTGTPFISTFYGGSGNLGRDYVLSFDAGTAGILAGAAYNPVAVQVSYTANTVVLRVPMSLLGNDDGNFSFVGVIGPLDKTSDVFPNGGLTTVRH